MGCDIHLHIEVKVDGQWHHYGAPRIERSYRLFAKMAGVRTDNPEQAIIQPRGLPEDITLITKMEWTDGGEDEYYHHTSWFGGEEISKLEDWLNEQGGQKEEIDLEWNILNSFLFGNSFAGPFKYYNNNVKIAGHTVEDVRFVFWFDN
jgi:hypothetical protein